MKKLRKFHNLLKSELLDQCIVSGKETNETNQKSKLVLCDIGCGPLTDLHKWNKYAHRVTEVLAIDKNKKALDNGIQRLNEKKKLKLKVTLFFYDIVSPVFETQFLPQYKNVCDILTLNFTLHYFWNSEKNFIDCVRNIHALLKPGGTWTGCYPNGDRIHQSFQEKGSSWKNSFAELVQCYDENGIFGKKYGMYLSESYYFDTYDDHDMSYEYLVWPRELEKRIKGLFEVKSHDSFKSMYDSKYTYMNLSPDEQEISFLYNFFTFTKI